ncbi:hypothetical protein N3K66_001663 [Trichothecium roseum]|uniref:Uncharacterized protein n=1 Tax=Trichothecium roseum TaxID=47278 RepID=A0ACC0V7E5_9HYPO|nr:hypothetical protein N3K66_001663 [Trichothecium roseum]
MAGQTPPSPSTAELGRPLVNLGARVSTVSSGSSGGAIHQGGHYGGGGIGSGSISGGISGGISGSGSGSGQEAPAPPPPPPPPSSSSSSSHVVVNSGTSRVLPGNLEDAGPGSHRPTTSGTTAGTTTTAASAATTTTTGSTNGSGGVPGLQQESSPGNIDNVHVASLQLGFSPDTIPYERWPADFASTRWLDLLASDAAQADSSFSLAGGVGGGSGGGDGASPSLSVNERSLLRPPVPRFPASLLAAHSSPALLNGQAQLPEDADPETERKAWQSDREARLAGREAVLFRHFADVCALWLDVFDPQRLFSTYATRLALRNPGLMKAILALAAKHRERALGRGRGRNSGSSSQKKERSGYDNDGGSVGGRSGNETVLPEQGTDGGGVGGVAGGGGLDRGEDMADKDDDEWIRYYYETLHYVREALVFPSYTHSEELLATAIVISAYEMLDESDGSGNWQRHLKGVFWIQRSQEVNGSCGGLRQAVWWAWLRQDIWAAFRERRPCFSFWRPVTDVAELDQHGLADRAIYLLSQAVNYSAEARRVEKTLASSTDPAAAQDQLRKRREDLVHKMERWKSFLGNEYRPLPTTTATATATATGTVGGTGGRGPGADVFTPLWIHPPEFGVAQQAYSFAQILVTLHSPSATGFGGFLRVQRDLAQATDTICGIAMELRDPGCRMMSAQCLYGAGLCVQEPARREAVLALMEDCEASICWPPIATWRQDLRREWEKVDAESRL